MKKIIMLLVAISSIAFFSGCIKEEADLIGTKWNATSESHLGTVYLVLEFFPDNEAILSSSLDEIPSYENKYTYYYSHPEIELKSEDSIFPIKGEVDGNKMIFYYPFDDSEMIVFKKK